MIDSSVQGIYFHPQRREILAVRPDSTPPGEPWVRFTEDHGMGLLAARNELEARGLVPNAGGVEWHGIAGSNPEQRSRVSDLIRELRDDPDSPRRETVNNDNAFLKRLISTLRSPLTSREEEA